MKTSTPRRDFSPDSVPELIKKLWKLYFDMSLDPALEESAEHVRLAAISLENTRRIALEIALECQSGNAPEQLEETMAHSEERVSSKLARKQSRFVSTMKH